MSLAIKNLKFINRSDGVNNSQVVFYQQNTAEDMHELDPGVAWLVITDCGKNDYHPFLFPVDFEVSASDSHGNYMPEQPALAGDAFEVIRNKSGDVLQKLEGTTATNGAEVEVRNNLKQGAIDALIMKDGKVMAQKSNVVPQEKAVFSFDPVLYVALASDVVQGFPMSSAVMLSNNAELDLQDVCSADIVMTGGGSGSSAQPYKFSLENVR